MLDMGKQSAVIVTEMLVNNKELGGLVNIRM